MTKYLLLEDLDHEELKEFLDKFIYHLATSYDITRNKDGSLYITFTQWD